MLRTAGRVLWEIPGRTRIGKPLHKAARKVFNDLGLIAFPIMYPGVASNANELTTAIDTEVVSLL